MKEKMIWIFEKVVMKRRLPMYYGKFLPKIGIGLVILHLLLGGAIYYAVINHGFALSSIALAAVYVILAGNGVTLGYHRMTTHKSFRAKPWMKNTLLFCACLAHQGAALWWSAVHIAHHAFSDRRGDPHSPNDGFLWAHMLCWMFEYKEPRLYERVKALADDTDIQRQSKYYSYAASLTFIVPPLVGLVVGGLGGALDAFLATSVVGLCFVLHSTWSVNSVCHLYESKPAARWLEKIPILNLIIGFQPQTQRRRSEDRSRNNVLVALVSFGEGNHYNHHKQPGAAFHSWRWWQPDFDKWVIIAMERLGIVKDVIRPVLYKT